MLNPILYKPGIHEDIRGQFFEHWVSGRPCANFAQDNVSISRPGVLRGFHTQTPEQGKYVTCLRGHIFDVAIDTRPSSPRFKDVWYWNLNDDNRYAVYLPPGFLHAFYVVGPEEAIVAYKCTERYAPDGQITVDWRTIPYVPWPFLDNPIVSDKDEQGVSFNDYVNSIKG